MAGRGGDRGGGKSVVGEGISGRRHLSEPVGHNGLL